MPGSTSRHSRGTPWPASDGQCTARMRWALLGGGLARTQWLHAMNKKAEIARVCNQSSTYDACVRMLELALSFFRLASGPDVCLPVSDHALAGAIIHVQAMRAPNQIRPPAPKPVSNATEATRWPRDNESDTCRAAHRRRKHRAEPTLGTRPPPPRQEKNLISLRQVQGLCDPRLQSMHCLSPRRKQSAQLVA